MVRGEVRLPRPRLLVFGNFLVPDFGLFDEVGSSGLDGLRSALFGVHLCDAAAAALLHRLPVALPGSGLQCSVEAIAEMPLRCAAESETLRRPAVGRCSLEPRRFLAQAKVRLMA